jgi:hypothetical protein
MPDYTTIQLTRETKDRLQSYGKMGDSFDSLINRILDQINGMKAEER